MVAATSAPASGRGTVWIVEDSAVEAGRIARCLDELGRVEHFQDPAFVVERIAGGARPDALVVDWELDGMNGVDLCKAVRARHDEATLPILMVTVHQQRCDVVDGLSAGANDYLVKPFREDELQARVRLLLRLKELHDRLPGGELAFEDGANDDDEQPRLRDGELQAARKLLFTVMGQLPVAAIVHGPDGRALLTNKKARALLGTSSAEAPYAAITSSADQPAARALRGEHVEDEELFWSREDGTKLHLRARAAPIVDDGGAVVAAVVVLEDVGDRAAAKLENERKEKAFGVVGHDLRNPLHTITMTTSMLLKKHVDDPATTRALLRILSSVERSNRLVKDLLDFTHVRFGGGLPVERRAVDLRALLEEHVADAAAAHPSRDVAFTCREASVVGHWDGERLSQVIANLLGNAVQHSRDDSPIRVALSVEGGAAVLSVENEGAPIPADKQAQIFQPFRRVDDGAPRPRSGLGLGLYIVKEIVRSHGGDVAVRCADGRVAFVVRLPLA